MNLLAELYNNQQNITQNPTGTIRTPRQIAYDNWLNAQQQAQNTTKDEWGQAIGNSVNGLAKIISSAVVKNPYERAGATRNLDNFDDRQDQLVRDWAMQRMKNRNDFVQQAKEQLGMATADEERDWNRDLTTQQLAYKKELDRINQENNERDFNERVRQFDEQMKFAKEQAKANAENKVKETQDKQIQETLANIQNIESNINNLSQAKSLNNQVKNDGDLMSVFTTALNPFAKTPSSNRLSPIYQAYTKETDPKKVEMEIEKMGYRKGMSTKAFNENTDRLLQENRNQLIQQYAKLGYKILQDDETGLIRVVDNNGKTIKEF